MTTNHDDLAGLLPDYAVGALGDADFRRVARHLDQCPPCRVQLEQWWELAGLFAASAPPSPAVRGRLLTLARSTVQETPPGNAPHPTHGAATGSAPASLRARAACPPADRRRAWLRRGGRTRLAVVGVAAAVALLLGVCVVMR